jgi:lactate permease
VAVLCLIFNAIPTTFGAVGTPLWFGFEALNLRPDTLAAVSAQTALLQGLVGLVLPATALRFVVSWKVIWRNLVFIQLSVLASVLPMFLVASFNYEFPAVVGGVIGLPVTILLARFGIGLERTAGTASESLFSRRVLLALAPLAATVAILLVTRIPAFGLRQWLTAAEPHLSVQLGCLGTLSVSPSLVIALRGILGQDLHWTHALLYVPSLIPFVLTAGLAFALFRSTPHLWGPALRETASRVGKPVLALFGALVFVSLLMTGGERASTHILGYTLAATTDDGWKYLAPFLGALGSFFSGSTTVSNLTFGSIQASIAEDTNLSPTVLLALQCAGAAMGNIICIHNIISVCAVLSLSGVEGHILKDALPAVAVFGLILVVVAVFL